MSNPCKKCGGTERHKDGRCVICQRERSRKWNDSHPEKIRAANRKWQAENPEKQREAVTRWQSVNSERTTEIKQKYERDNPQYGRAKNQARRGRIAKAEGSFTLAEWKALCKQYNNRCCYPGCDRTDLHADHVVPLAKGGSNAIDNIQPLCSYHNQSKGTKVSDYRNKSGLIRWIQNKLFG